MNNNNFRHCGGKTTTIKNLLFVSLLASYPSKAEVVDASTFADSLQLSYQLLTNVPNDACLKERGEGHCFTAELELKPVADYPSKNWSIYFSQINPVQSDDSALFDITHINGDLHQITPTEKFAGFKAGQTYTLPYRVDFWSLSESDAMPNYIFVDGEQKPAIITSSKAKIDPQTGLEYLPFVKPYTSYEHQFKRSKNDKTQWADTQVLFKRNAKMQAVNQHVEHAIIPTPKLVKVDAQSPSVDLSKGIRITQSAFDEVTINAALERLSTLGVAQSVQGLPVTIKQGVNKGINGGYQLSIGKDTIEIQANDASGAFYALQSIAALITLDDKTVAQMHIEDAPNYGFRGMMVDVARNFHSKQFILDLLEQMAAYKLNKLHLHLGDDEGWRLQIPGLEELTEVSSKRCFDLTEQRCLLPQLGAGIDANSEVNGFYSVADYQEILRFAQARHIQVIPSLDMPGHSRSSIVAMKARYNKYKALGDMAKAEQYLLHDPADKTIYSSVQYYNDNTINVCLESSYVFISKVMDEVKAIHQEAGQPLTRYHIGADETAGAWVDSPACQQFIANNHFGITDKANLGGYFIERVANILAEKGIESAGWNDGLMHTTKGGMPDVVQANSWGVLFWQGHQAAHELANRNWQIVASSPDVTYFDFPYEADPKEHGYYWAIRYSNTEKLFQFMPDNLPIHAEFWKDRQEQHYTAQDTLVRNDDGSIKSAPMAKGNKFIGVQGQLWSENTRNDDLAEYKIFPRLFALAERGWHKPDWHVPYNYAGAKYDKDTHVFTDELKQKRDQAWANFSHAMVKKELPKLELANIHYRLPTLGAVVKDKYLHINSALPGLAMEYQLADGNWQVWHEPVKLADEVLQTSQIKVRARSYNGQRVGRALTIKHQQ